MVDDWVRSIELSINFPVVSNEPTGRATFWTAVDVHDEAEWMSPLSSRTEVAFTGAPLFNRFSEDAWKNGARQMPRVELKKIIVRRFAIIFGMIQAVIGLVYSLLVAVGSLAFIPPSVSYALKFVAPSILPLKTGVGISSFLIPETGAASFPVPPMILMAVTMSVEGLLVGFFQGAVLAWLYNLVARRFSGLILVMRFSFLEPEPRSMSAKVSGKKSE
jgi:hypothetical protein